MRINLAVSVATTLLASLSVSAVSYSVNRSFTDGIGTATVVGTVDLPLGTYTIQNQAPHPFTAVNLTLTVNGTSLPLIGVGLNVSGTGILEIEANATQLLLSAAGDSANPANLRFHDGFTFAYAIGDNGAPAFEAASTSAGNVNVVNSVVFPNEVFGVARGTATPDAGSTLTLLALGLVATGTLRAKR